MLNKNSIPETIEQTILSKAPSDIRDCIVLFKEPVANNVVIIEGYLASAGKIISGIDCSSTDDELIYPLFNLYVHAIEFSLKLLIYCLVEHHSQQTCIEIKAPPNRYEEELNSHRCDNLAEIASKMLPEANELHEFIEFGQIKKYIDSMVELGITSISSRYLREKSQSPYKLHEQQRWVKINKLNEEITLICEKIIYYCLKDEFHLCATGEYSSKRLNELKTSLGIMKKLKPALSLITMKENVILQEVDGLEFKSTHIDDSEHDDYVLNTKEALKDLSHEELAYLEMGLHFPKGATKVESFDYFMKFEQEENLETIISLKHNLDLAIERLMEHIAVVEDILTRKIK